MFEGPWIVQAFGMGRRRLSNDRHTSGKLGLFRRQRSDFANHGQAGMSIATAIAAIAAVGTAQRLPTTSVTAQDQFRLGPSLTQFSFPLPLLQVPTVHAVVDRDTVLVQILPFMTLVAHGSEKGLRLFRCRQRRVAYYSNIRGTSSSFRRRRNGTRPWEQQPTTGKKQQERR
jgi:hypothetical protein